MSCLMTSSNGVSGSLTDLFFWFANLNVSGDLFEWPTQQQAESLSTKVL